MVLHRIQPHDRIHDVQEFGLPYLPVIVGHAVCDMLNRVRPGKLLREVLRFPCHHPLNQHGGLLSAANLLRRVVRVTIIVVRLIVCNVHCLIEWQCSNITLGTDEVHDGAVLLEYAGCDDCIAPCGLLRHIIGKYFRVKCKPSKCTCSWHDSLSFHTVIEFRVAVLERNPLVKAHSLPIRFC